MSTPNPFSFVPPAAPLVRRARAKRKEDGGGSGGDGGFNMAPTAVESDAATDEAARRLKRCRLGARVVPLTVHTLTGCVALLATRVAAH